MVDFLVRYGYLVLGFALLGVWAILFLNRQRIGSPWLRSLLGLSMDDPLLKAAMQGRKDFTAREKWGWTFVIALMVGIVIFKLAR